MLKRLKNTLITASLLLIAFSGHSQSSPVKVTNIPLPVSVSGGTFTPTGTTTVTPSAGSVFTTTPKAGSVFTVTPNAGSTFTVHDTGTQTVQATGTNTITQLASTTLTISATGSYTASTTYSNVSVAGTNTITSGALSVSVANVGTNGALFNGTTLPPGAVINLNMPNAILPQYTYNCLTSNLLIIVNR